MKKKLFYTLFLLIFSVLTAKSAYSDTILYLVSEIKANKGEIKVKLSGGKNFSALKPLQSLKAGDMVSATKNGYTVLLETASGKAVTVREGNSPFTVKGSTKQEDSSFKNLFAKIGDSLKGKKKDLNYVPLVVRSIRLKKPTIVMPKDTLLLNEKPMFVWTGSSRDEIIIKLKDSLGRLVFQKTVLSRYSLKFPDEIQSLKPGSYSWELEIENSPAQKAGFQIPYAGAKEKVYEKLKYIDSTKLSKTTKAILKSELLLSENFIEDARVELVKAYLNDKEEPTIHLLLGEIYKKIGQTDLSLEEFDEAQYLLQ